MPGTRKLGRDTAHRTAMLRAMVTFLLENGRIETTLYRAKEVRSLTEKMITLAKESSLHNKRLAMAFITKEDVVKKLFDEIAPKYAQSNGGYTRIMKLGPRRGDAAEMADNATASYDVQRNTDAQNSVNSADYIPMIMLDGVLYRDTYDMVDADSVDESKAAYAESYTDGVPANDGEVNFDMNPSRNSAYIVCDDGSLVVKVEGNWYRFERAE